jgi:hypothetical protein
MNKKLTIAVFLVGLIIIVMTYFFREGPVSAIKTNIWSIQTINRYHRNNDGGVEEFPEPPSTHPHGQIWLGQIALQQNAYKNALEYLVPLSESRNPIALGALAEAYYLSGEYQKSLNLWQRVEQTDCSAVEKLDIAIREYYEAMEV